jgi:hypothetical protein
MVTGNALPQAVAYLEGRAADAVSAGPGPAAKLTLAVVAGGRDPRSFGGLDLVTALTAPVPAGTPVALAGAYGDDLYDHLIVVLALVAAGEPVPPPALDLIRQTQATNGGWAFDGATTPEATDSNTTALAIQALVAAGLPGDAGILDGSDLANDPAMVKGLRRSAASRHRGAASSSSRPSRRFPMPTRPRWPSRRSSRPARIRPRGVGERDRGPARFRQPRRWRPLRPRRPHRQPVRHAPGDPRAGRTATAGGAALPERGQRPGCRDDARGSRPITRCVELDPAA